MSDFHMVVCVKAVPGSTEVKMDPKTNTIVRDGKQAVINPFDASALECALALKDDFIGFGMDVRVTVVSMGIPATELLLRDCIARGADDALLLTDRRLCRRRYPGHHLCPQVRHRGARRGLRSAHLRQDGGGWRYGPDWSRACRCL